MQVRHHRILLGGMLVAFQGFVYAQGAGPVQHPETPAIRVQRAKQSSHEDHDLLRNKADEAIGKANVLRRKQTEKSLRTAVAWFQKGVSLYKAVGLFSNAADAEIQTGEIHFLAGQFESALKSYNQALILARGDTELRCRALSRMARIYAIRGQATQADSYSRQALPLSSGLSDKTQAEALLARGEAVRYSGVDKAAERATDLFVQARQHFVQAKDTDGEAQTLLSLAYLRFDGGPSDRAEALRFAGEALRLWSSTNNTDGIARAHFALGIFATRTGEFETAQCNYQDALRVFHILGDKDNEAITLNGLGYVTRERGDGEASLEHYRQAKAIFTSLQDQLGVAGAITEMGKTLSVLGRDRELLPLYMQKLRLARNSKFPFYEASALAEMAHVYELEGQYRKAQQLFDHALAANTGHVDAVADDILMALAHFQAEQTRYSQAISTLESARLHKENGDQVEDVARIDYELADIYRTLNRLQDARAMIEKSIAVIEAQRLKIASFDSRAAYFAFVHKYYSLYIQILMLLHQQHPEQGFLQLAFEASEKSKVRSLLDLLSSTSHGSSCDELLQKQLALTNSGQMQTVATQSAYDVPVLASKEIQAEIGGEDTVLLEYALGDKQSYIWVVDHNQIIAHELPGAEQIRKLVQQVRGTLTARQPKPGENLDQYRTRVQQADRAYRVYGQRLSRLLMGSVTLGRAKRVLIVPDGSLQYVPFPALPLPGAAEKNEFLVNRYEVVVLPSVSALKTLRQAVSERPEPSSLAAIFANPVFEPDDPRVHSRGSARQSISKRPSDLNLALRDVNASGHIDSLPGSSDEAKAISKALGERDVFVAEGFNATRDYVLKGGLAPYRMIHFATHGIIDALHPEMSGLILSLISRSGERQDGYLRLGDIYNLKLSADLVVLSACQSALGKDLESEGTIGLPRGFLQAGARSVIASLWKVDDEATAHFMKVFYERIQQHDSPSSALRSAQLAMLRDHKWSAPFYWASFVLQGDYH